MTASSRFAPRRPITAGLLCAAALISVTSGCGLIEFDIDQPIPEQTVQGSPLGVVLPTALFKIPLNIDLEAATKARDAGPATAAYLKAVTLEVRSPPGETFEFMDEITISVAGEGLPERMVASLNPVPATPRIDLKVVGDVDLLPYIKKGATLNAAAGGHLPKQDVKFDGKVVVRIKI